MPHTELLVQLIDS